MDGIMTSKVYQEMLVGGILALRENDDDKFQLSLEE